MEGTKKQFTSSFQAADIIENWLGAFKALRKHLIKCNDLD
jgi:hypothetical protein